MAVSSPRVQWKLPRRIRFSVISANHRSTRFSQLAEGGSEVDVEARALQQPALDESGFMGGVVVHDQVHVQLRRHAGLDGVEEVAELRRAVAALGAADDLAGLRIEGGEQGGGAVAQVIVGA